MAEIQVIKILIICIGAMGIAFWMLNRQNDKLRRENKQLKEQNETETKEE